MIDQKLLVSTKDIVSGTSSDGILEMLFRESGQYQLEYFKMTNNLYNVSTYNNGFALNWNSTNYTFSLTAGYYSETDLASALKTALDTATGATWTVSYSASTGKFTMAPDSSTFYTKSCIGYKLWGFNNSDGTAAASHESDFPIDIWYPQALFVKFYEDEEQSIVGKEYFSASLYIPADSSFGGVIEFKAPDHAPQFIHLVADNRIKFKWFDQYRQAINLNTADWMLILQKK